MDFLSCKFVVFSGKNFLGNAVDLFLSRLYSNLSERSTFFQPDCYFEFVICILRRTPFQQRRFIRVRGAIN